MEKGKVDMEQIRRYVRGELTPREMYALERQAQADPMLMDILLGMEQDALDVHGDNLADIRKRIAERSGRRQTAIRRLLPVQRWAIAASVLAMLTVGTWWFTREDRAEPTEAMVEQGKTVVEQREAIVEPREPLIAAAPKELLPKANETTPQRARSTSTEITVSEQMEKKEERLDSVVVVGFGTQKKTAVVGAVDYLAAAEMDSPALTAQASHPGDVRIRGISARRLQPQRMLTGKVVDEETKKPMADVALQITADQRITTDALGRFTLPDTTTTLTLTYIGYEPKTVDIGGIDTLTVALKRTHTSPDEVVVVGYGTKNPSQTVSANFPKASKPTPKDGWDAYRQYLKDAVKLAPSSGARVDLTFTVDEDGRPTNIAVIETTDEQLNAFAMLIVRDGPRWLPGEADERNVTLRVNF